MEHQEARFPRDRPGKPGIEPHTLSEVLDRLVETGGEESVCVRDIMAAIGRRSFGPLLLAPSIIVVSPASGIPGLPTVTAILVALIAGQMLMGRHGIWLPQRVQNGCIDRAKLDRAVRFLRPVARVSDRVARPRLSPLTRPPFSSVIAGICLLIAFTMPPMEVIPMANSLAGAAIASFALALTAQDGVLAIVASAITLPVLYLAVNAIL